MQYTIQFKHKHSSQSWYLRQLPRRHDIHADSCNDPSKAKAFTLLSGRFALKQFLNQTWYYDRTNFSITIKTKNDQKYI